MIKWISILRGINVGGKRVIKMTELRALYLNLGFVDVETIIQSGNVTFSSSIKDNIEVKNKIESEISKVFGFDVMTIVFEEDYLKKVIENNPFKNEDVKTQYFTFLENEPTKELISNFEDKYSNSGEVVCGEKVVYGFCPNGFSKSKFTNNFIENKLKVNATTRNFKTTIKLMF